MSSKGFQPDYSGSAVAPNSGGVLAGLASRAERYVPAHAGQTEPTARSRIDVSKYVPDLGPRFEVLERMQGNATGLVFKVFDKDLDRLAAVKVLPYFDIGEVLESRLFREIKAMSVLKHPNILDVCHYGKSMDGAPYMVTELFEGKTLSSLIDDNHGCDPLRAASIFIQLLEALSYAHRHNVTHRDLNPDHVLVTQTQDGRDVIKLTDFGIARTVLESIPEQSRAGASGRDSDCYVSPEQIRGDVFDPRSDIYSLGCLMYELLAGRPPFNSRDAHLTEEPARFKKTVHEHELSARLEMTILRCLEKKPLERFKSADAVLYHLTSEVVHNSQTASAMPVTWTKIMTALVCLASASLPFLVAKFFAIPLWSCLTVYGGIALLVILAKVYNLDQSYRLRTRSKDDDEQKI